MVDRLADGRVIRLLTVIDEYTRRCLAIRVAHSLKSEDVLAVLCDLFFREGRSTYIRSDNGSESRAKELVVWLEELGVETVYIAPGSLRIADALCKYNQLLGVNSILIL